MKITVFNDDCENLFIFVQEDDFPVSGMLISKQASTGNLHDDLDLFDGSGLGTVYDGSAATVIALRLWNMAFAEITDDGVKPLRGLGDDEKTYLGIR